MSLSAHLMFWYSENWRDETRDFFAQHAPSLTIQTHPLIWVKSDNAGLVTDVRRRPRHVYETCLLASRGDRHIVGPKADAYSSPTDKTLHPSTKPEPMLKHFMGMLVDENTTLFDPTAGSGAALRAGEALGATKVLGLEIDPKTCELAQQALRNSRRLRQAASAL
jgi:DNA modification methylase